MPKKEDNIVFCKLASEQQACSLVSHPCSLVTSPTALYREQLASEQQARAHPSTPSPTPAQP